MGRITDIIQQMEKSRTPGAKDKQQRKKKGISTLPPESVEGSKWTKKEIVDLYNHHMREGNTETASKIREELDKRFPEGSKDTKEESGEKKYKGLKTGKEYTFDQIKRVHDKAHKDGHVGQAASLRTIMKDTWPEKYKGVVKEVEESTKKSLDDYVTDMMKAGHLNEPSTEIQVKEPSRRPQKATRPQENGKWVKKSEMSLDDYITTDRWK